MSPKLLYLGNSEDLRDGVGNIFARKVMQIPNLETVDNGTVIFSKGSSFRNSYNSFNSIHFKIIYFNLIFIIFKLNEEILN